jgi:hypothetical protein
MKLTLRTLLTVSTLLAPVLAVLPGCNQADNPKPTAAPPPPAPKPEEVALPKIKGKTYDPASNPRYKKMQESKARQSGGSVPE